MRDEEKTKLLIHPSALIPSLLHPLVRDLCLDLYGDFLDVLFARSAHRILDLFGNRIRLVGVSLPYNLVVHNVDDARRSVAQLIVKKAQSAFENVSRAVMCN